MVFEYIIKYNISNREMRTIYYNSLQETGEVIISYLNGGPRGAKRRNDEWQTCKRARDLGA